MGHQNVDSYGKLEGIDTSGRDTFPQLLITGEQEKPEKFIIIL